ncbi:MAG TPA: sugar ABC transporter permease [Pseudonocardia sp.]|uniref:carbohydrate ABC transporter permease n=1 Tax=Pseudonocardia sp. TaxID=60912 RepID=UPI002B4AC4A9|nr:sugar ABC transporter permease [Pseudonocardia sp.]HLU57729.1 sugar ABC transporter permease [Pseudonocardia sp.]
MSSATVGARQNGSLSWLVLPALVFFTAFGIIPLIGVLLLSFTSWNGIGEIVPIGFENWVSVLSDPGLYHSLGVTFLIMGLSWLVQTPMSILVGVFTAGQQRYRGVLAVLYFTPLLLSSAAIAITYKALLDPNFGLGASLGIPLLVQNWLGDPVLAIATVVFVVSWQYIPFHALIYQGAVRQIPASLYEAARIDGAGRVRQFFSITLPQLKYTMITSSTMIVAGSMTLFDLIFVLTLGGPSDATRVLALDMYLRGFRGNMMGPASVIALIIVVVAVLLAMGIQRLGGKDANASQLEGA